MSDKPEFKPPPFFYPVEVDLYAPIASFRQSVKEGNFYYIKFQVSRDIWELFESLEPGLHLKGPLYRVRDDASDETPADKEKAKEKPKRKPAKEKEPLTLAQRFWQGFCGHGSLNNADLRQALVNQGYVTEDGDVKQAIYRVFSDGQRVVESLSEIEPAEFIALLEHWQLNALAISASRILREVEAEK